MRGESGRDCEPRRPTCPRDPGGSQILSSNSSKIDPQMNEKSIPKRGSGRYRPRIPFLFFNKKNEFVVIVIVVVVVVASSAGVTSKTQKN